MSEKKKVTGKAVDWQILKRIFAYAKPHRRTVGFALTTTISLALLPSYLYYTTSLYILFIICLHLHFYIQNIHTYTFIYKTFYSYTFFILHFLYTTHLYTLSFIFILHFRFKAFSYFTIYRWTLFLPTTNIPFIPTIFSLFKPYKSHPSAP